VRHIRCVVCLRGGGAQLTYTPASKKDSTTSHSDLSSSSINENVAAPSAGLAASSPSPKSPMVARAVLCVLSQCRRCLSSSCCSPWVSGCTRVLARHCAELQTNSTGQCRPKKHPSLRSSWLPQARSQRGRERLCVRPRRAAREPHYKLNFCATNADAQDPRVFRSTRKASVSRIPTTSPRASSCSQEARGSGESAVAAAQMHHSLPPPLSVHTNKNKQQRFFLSLLIR
jgi:hypothetical protein